MHCDPQLLDGLVRRIVQAVHPLRIILFGSAARGQMGPHSDLDVLVVMPDGIHPQMIARCAPTSAVSFAWRCYASLAKASL
jgi:predicted nucleotidyltransferase